MAPRTTEAARPPPPLSGAHLECRHARWARPGNQSVTLARQRTAQGPSVEAGADLRLAAPDAQDAQSQSRRCTLARTSLANQANGQRRAALEMVPQLEELCLTEPAVVRPAEEVGQSITHGVNPQRQPSDRRMPVHPFQPGQPHLPDGLFLCSEKPCSASRRSFLPSGSHATATAARADARGRPVHLPGPRGCDPQSSRLTAPRARLRGANGVTRKG